MIINLNNCYNSSLTESSNMEKQASQPTSNKRRGKKPFFLYHFFSKLRMVAGQRIPGLPWASYKPQRSHCHSRQHRQTIMGHNFLLADERIQQFSFMRSTTPLWHSIISSASPARDGPVACLPPSRSFTCLIHNHQLHVSGCATSEPALGSHSYYLNQQKSPVWSLS